MTAFLRPRAVAIIGASDNSRWSRAAFDNLVGGGFAGEVHLVNRRGGTVHGRAAFSSATELPPGVDMGIVLVPAQAAEAAVHDLAAAGVKTVAMLTAGFAETGEAGAAAQQKIVAMARAHGMRLLGPNTLGFLNFVDRTLVWTTPIKPPHRAEGVAIISQSGATAFFLTELAARQGVGLSYVVATGNEADRDSSHFVADVIADDATRAVALFIETVRDPERFLAVARAAFAAKKPLVVLKAGRSETTAKSALAHTGALVGDDRVFDGICQQYGLIRVSAIEELLATADILGRTGVLRPGGLAVISNSGGICEIAADTASARGVALPPLTQASESALRDALPAFGTPHNPLDLTGAITPEQSGETVRVLAAQPDIAAVLVPYYAVPVTENEVSDRLTALYENMARAIAKAPVPGLFVSYTATHMTALSHDIVARTGLPYAACGLDRAISAFSGALWWSERQRAGLPPPREAVEATDGSPRPVTEQATLEHLARHGVPVVPARLAASADAAVAFAEKIGGPVVLKIASAGIAHKSDIGGVALDLAGQDAIRSAYDRIRAAAAAHAPQAAIDGVLVAPMRARGIELFVGITRDAQWGPVLAVGLGGVFVEVLNDVALRLLPVALNEVLRMLRGLRGAALLAGARGVPAADLDAVAAAIARIGDAALALGPNLAALDVNPLWVRGADIEALDALCVWND
jgi:acyl-CoA synthetase (NDP forming)